MIINIRGTSGSGKSTLARAIMEKYEERKELFVKGRKPPIGYLLTPPRSSFGSLKLFVLGYYPTTHPRGGVDGIPTRDQQFQLVRAAGRKGHNILMEGVVLSDEVRRTTEVIQQYGGVVICLTTDIEVCVQRVNKRRRTKNPHRTIDQENTRRRVAVIERAMTRLKEAGVKIQYLSWEEAFEYLLRELGLPLDA